MVECSKNTKKQKKPKKTKLMNPKIVKCHIHQDINQEISNEMFQESNGTA